MKMTNTSRILFGLIVLFILTTPFIGKAFQPSTIIQRACFIDRASIMNYRPLEHQRMGRREQTLKRRSNKIKMGIQEGGNIEQSSSEFWKQQKQLADAIKDEENVLRR